MKKSLISIVCFLIVVQFSAQSPNPLKRVDAGIRVGLNVSRLNTDTVTVESSARVGYDFGAFIRVNVSKHFYIEPAVEYYVTTPELVTNIGSSTIPELKDQLGIHTLQIPLNIGLRLFKGPLGSFAVRIKGGGTGAFILNVDDNKFNLEKGDFNSANFLVNGGIGVDIFHLTIDMDYHNGLTDVLKDFDAQNRMFTVAVGLKF